MYTLKKSLGQHFLKDESIVDRIIGLLDKETLPNLLEVGPGGGALTRKLLTLRDKRFFAIEIDKEKSNYLENTLPGIKGKIISNDFLKTDPPFDEPFIVIGNFPYNISTQILFRILEWKSLVPLVIGMFQKEVAERICSGPGSKVYGVISVLIQAHYHVEYLFDVPPESFNPPPKVMSGVIRLVRKNEPLKVKSIKSFELLVKTAFSQRRKTMRNAVKSIFDPEVLKNPLFDKRAEQLSLEQFAELTFLCR